MSKGSWSSETACEFYGFNYPSEGRTFDIGFTELYPIGWNDIIDQYHTINNLPSSLRNDGGGCYNVWWSGAVTDDTNQGAVNYNVAGSPPGTSAQVQPSHIDTADNIHIWYKNDLCKARLYVQSDGTGEYCELTLGDWWTVDIVPYCGCCLKET